MRYIHAEITSRQPDGGLTWCRFGASYPKGSIPSELIPDGLEPGQQVRLTVVSNARGEMSVIACTPLGVSSKPILQAIPSKTPHRPVEVPPKDEPTTGDIYWVDIRNPLENPLSTGKLRPAVLVDRSGLTSWRVMGLTTKNQFADGSSRTPIPDHNSVGLSGPGYLWGANLTRVNDSSIGVFIGEADQELLRAIIKQSSSDMTSAESAAIQRRIRELEVVDQESSSSSPLVHIVRAPGTSRRFGFDSLREYFESNLDRIEESLRFYYSFRSGRFFDVLSALGRPDQLDGSEIAAATCLSLRFDHVKIASLLSIAPQIEKGLARVPRATTIWSANSQLFDESSPLGELYAMIDDLPGFGAAYTSKILAAKRPDLIPIRDGEVSSLLGHPEKWWQEWHLVMADPQFRALLHGLRSRLSLSHVSLLRIADVALWERAIGES